MLKRFFDSYIMLNVLLDYSTITKETLDELKTRRIQSLEALNNHILGLAELTWSILVQPGIDLNNSYLEKGCLEMKSFHTDKSIRDHATAVSNDLDQFYIENSMRKDVYAVFKRYADGQYLVEKPDLSTEQISYFTDVMDGYTHAGMELSDADYTQVKAIQKEITDLCSKYQSNVDSYEKEFQFTAADLDGVSANMIASHTKDNGAVVFTLDYPDYTAIMEYCKNREVRKMVSLAHQSQALENGELLERITKLRQENARLFGVEHHSDYKLNATMAETTTAVNQFLDNVQTILAPLLERDLAILRAYALADGVTEIQPYDIAYYSRVYKETESNLKQEDVKKCFPTDRTIRNVFAIYQQLLGYTFTQIASMTPLWHHSVNLFEVKEGDAVKGYFYLDLFPREGKYDHFAVFPFIEKSAVTLPVALMGCNFSADFLTFDEVETLFHEFGHVMHFLSSRSTIADTSSFTCEADFVETPSQMFEEWCYCPDTLGMLSPDLTSDMIAKILRGRQLLQGYQYSRQLMFCRMDMYIHSSAFHGGCFDVVAKFEKEILGFDAVVGTNRLAAFSHLVGGYDAGYYGYMYSLAFAKDLFIAFKGKELDPVLGQRFKDAVLSQGSIRPSLESVIAFLGREPDMTTFIKSLE
jgi:Zn-dependent oligopeptidase